MFLRRVKEADAEILFEWSNDPITRQNSFSPEKIVWENHIKWFQKKLEDNHCLFYIAVDESDNKYGTIRLDFDDKFQKCTISYNVAPKHRKKGVGAQLINLCESELKNQKISCTLIGEVKPENIASVKCFLNNGFQETAPTEIERVFMKKV